MMEWVVMSGLFLAFYAGCLYVSYLLDKFLRKRGKKGIWPEDYFNGR